MPEGDLEVSTSKTSAGPWQPRLHFVWHMIIGDLLPPEGERAQGTFGDFYRTVVDGTY